MKELAHYEDDRVSVATTIQTKIKAIIFLIKRYFGRLGGVIYSIGALILHNGASPTFGYDRIPSLVSQCQCCWRIAGESEERNDHAYRPVYYH